MQRNAPHVFKEQQQGFLHYNRALPRARSRTLKRRYDKNGNSRPGMVGKIKFYIVDFFKAPPEKYTAVKTVLGFPFGAALGLILYHLVLDFTWLEESTRHFLGGVFVLGLASGYALSVQVRCITCLLLPTFFGKTGRSYIATFAVIYLISGPIHTIIVNGHEVTRSLGCTTELLANHTKERWKLATSPIGKVMDEFQEEGMFINKVVKRIDEEFGPMKKEVMDNSEEDKMKKNTEYVDRTSGNTRGNRAKQIEQNNKPDNSKEYKKVENEYRKKLEYRCQDVWNQGVIKCQDKFKSMYRQCRDKIPIVGGLLCLPFKLSIVCELVRLVPGVLGSSCNSNEAVSQGFGEVFVAAKEMTVEMDNDFKANLQYKVVNTPEAVDVTTAEEVRKKTLHKFKNKQVWLEFGLSLMQRLMAFTFILVFISAYKYNKAYLTDIRHDNMYITSYFRHIDARRQKLSKTILLPLKKVESDACIFLTNPKLMKAEKKKIVKGTIMLVIRALIFTVIIMSSDLLYSVLDIIRRHSRIDYHQQGEHIVDIDIFGTGFMSEIVRLFLKAFSHNDKIDNVSTNYECLPRPVKMEQKYVLLIYGTFGVLWVLMLFEAYGLRLRRLVASGFYRSREKKRVLYQYNDMLKKRRGFLRHMRHHIRKQVKKKNLLVKSGLTTSLRKEFPRLCGWLKIFHSGKLSCLICEDPERKDFVRCLTPGCNVGYCMLCWCDIRKRCYSCNPGRAEADDLSDLSDDGHSDSDSSDV
ncbi:DC-STAMP domain-containing protein 1-like [Mizuhopecten yessoensis]|uniref:DC-STAMP domain-containing protein 1 n=1 Tax=Mizuhopecten yessoensis TaxID=6573 RepID=A0A210R0Y4_MIZYE|nr:DC-STAMP domain-containing protein 1-like [Mizuhopecten yessoensis]OWF54551.1 DC-STAMP domain-containing protein 1 [Mizuhopecten yessoensis]